MSGAWQVLAFIAGQAARGEEADRASVPAAMWHVLRLLAVNGGSLRSQTKGGKTKEQLTPGEGHSMHLTFLQEVENHILPKLL